MYVTAEAELGTVDVDINTEGVFVNEGDDPGNATKEGKAGFLARHSSPHE